MLLGTNDSVFRDFWPDVHNFYIFLSRRAGPLEMDAKLVEFDFSVPGTEGFLTRFDISKCHVGLEINLVSIRLVSEPSFLAHGMILPNLAPSCGK